MGKHYGLLIIPNCKARSSRRVPLFAEGDDGLEKIRLENLRGNVLSVREAQKDIGGGGGR